MVMVWVRGSAGLLLRRAPPSGSPVQPQNFPAALLSGLISTAMVHPCQESPTMLTNPVDPQDTSRSKPEGCGCSSDQRLTGEDPAPGPR